MIYFDNAATTFPKPPIVLERVNHWLAHGVGSPGRGEHNFAARANDQVSTIRQRLAKFFGIVDESRFIYTYSATDALNLAIKGVLNQGDHVIISSMEHNSVLRPLRGMEAEGKISLDIVEANTEGLVDVSNIAMAIKPETKLVIIAHASNVTGSIQPVAEVGRLVREKGILLLVDAAQSTGVIPTNIETLQADMLAFAGHKGLFGIQGTGGLVLGPRVHQLRPYREGGTGFNSTLEHQPTNWPESFEAGTYNTPGIISLGAGLDFIEEMGLDEICRIEQEHCFELWNGLRKLPGLRLYGPEPGAGKMAIVTFTLGEWDTDDIAHILNDNYEIHVRTGLHCSPLAHKTIGTYPNGAVRISPGVFTTYREIKTLIAAIKTLASTQVSL